jgi:hypothetical protein
MAVRDDWLRQLRLLEPRVLTDAKAAGAASRHAPVDLAAVAQRVGARVVVDRDGQTRGHGTTTAGRAGFEVRVSGVASEALTPRQRFTVAHELGHVLFLQAGLGPASTRGEYWLLEEACNRAAGRILVPPWLAPRDAVAPQEVASWLTALQVRAGLSLEAASKELVLSAPNGIATIGLVPTGDDRTLVRWSLSGRGDAGVPAARTKLPGDSSWSRLVAAARERPDGIRVHLGSYVASADVFRRTTCVCVLEVPAPALGTLFDTAGSADTLAGPAWI